MSMNRSLAALALALVAAVAAPARADHDTDGVIVKNKPSQPVPVAGTVAVSNLPAVQQVTVTNFPTSAPPSTVTVSNLPAVQAVSGSVTVSNLPAVQTVMPQLNPYGLFNLSVNTATVSSGTTSYVFSSNGVHTVQTSVYVSASCFHGQPAPMAEILLNLASGPVFLQLPMKLVRADSSGNDFYAAQTQSPIYLGPNTNMTLAFTRDSAATGYLQGTFAFNGINLD